MEEARFQANAHARVLARGRAEAEWTRSAPGTAFNPPAGASLSPRVAFAVAEATAVEQMDAQEEQQAQEAQEAAAAAAAQEAQEVKEAEEAQGRLRKCG